MRPGTLIGRAANTSKGTIILECFTVWPLLWTEFIPPTPKFICWSPNPPVWLYLEIVPIRRYLAFNEAMRVEPSSVRISALIPRVTRQLASPLSCHLPPSPFWDYSAKAATCKSGRELSPEHNKVDTLILNFPASKTARNIFYCFLVPSLWYFVIAAWADYSHPKL